MPTLMPGAAPDTASPRERRTATAESFTSRRRLAIAPEHVLGDASVAGLVQECLDRRGRRRQVALGIEFAAPVQHLTRLQTDQVVRGELHVGRDVPVVLGARSE